MMYLLYMMVKYVFFWIVITFKDSGDIICNNMSYTYHMIAKYEGNAYLASILIYLYNTCYVSGLVMDKRLVS